MAVWAGARCQRRPKAVFSRRRCTEGLNRAEGIATGDHGEDGEQQNIRQLVYLAFGSTRVGNIAEHRKELIEGLHGNLLVIWLPDIDSEILPRRNPATVAGSHVLAQLLRRRLTLLTQMYRALNSPDLSSE